MIADDKYERELWDSGYNYIASVDESGMGCLAGDVYVAAVIFPNGNSS